MTLKDWLELTEGSLEIGKDKVRNMLGWLDYVPECEFTLAEHKRLLAGLFEVYKRCQPIAEKYCDYLQKDNPRFDREHFLAVVRGEKALQSRPKRVA